MDLAIKDVQHHLGKFLATIAGVGLLFMIVLVMDGIYRGNIADGLWMINNTPADLWVVERFRGGPFNEQSRLTEDSYRSIAATPGVAAASPYITYTVERRMVARKSQQFTIVGYDIFGELGAPTTIVSGRTIRRAHYELVADQKLGLALGQQVHLGVHDYTVVGLTKGAVDTAGNPIIYLSLHDAQEVLYQQDNEALYAQRDSDLRRLRAAGLSYEQAYRLVPVVSSHTNTINAVLVRLSPGANPDKVARQIQDWLYFNVYTPQQESELMLKGRIERMSAMLNIFRSLLIVISTIIIALIIYVLTAEKIRSIATLKLIGASNWIIVRLVLEQAVVLTASSFACACPLAMNLRDKLPRTLVFFPSDILITLLVMLIGGVLASLLAIWVALKTPPSLALGG